MGGPDISAGKQKERWIRFQGSVNAKSAEALMRAVDDCYAERITHVHLMMSSLGGDVFLGTTLFSQLRRLPVKLSTYNVATLQSIGVTLFCAGIERYCVPEATFMIHPVTWTFFQNQTLTAQQIQEFADTCTVGTRSLANILAGVTGRDENHVYEDMKRTTRFNAEQSIAYGLVNRVVTDLFPAGTAYTTIDEEGNVRHCPAEVPDPRSSSISDILAGLKLSSAPVIPSLPAKLN
jgi:ATP-dependent Clp protease protease subunit